MKSLLVLLATGAAMFAQTPPSKSAAPAAPKAPAENPLLHPASLNAKAPEEFSVKFSTTAGDFTVAVHRAWSPLGADRFYNLVRNRFFTNATFFRVLPGFIAQFGLNADPKVNAAWESARIKDDPPKPGVSNKAGTLVFAAAGAGTRTTQLFVNFGNNTPLDPQASPANSAFTPFAEVTEGMDAVKNIYSGYGGDPGIDGGHGPTQDKVGSQGKPYLDKNFPLLTVIKSATVIPATSTPPAAPKK